MELKQIYGNTITGSKSTYKGYLRMDIYYTITDTRVSAEVRVYFVSMYAIDDINNSYYYNTGSTIDSNTKAVAVTIKHPVSTGGGWDTQNITLLTTQTYTYDRGKSNATAYFSAKLTGIDNLGSSNVMSVTGALAVDALPSYTISYNANGGTGAPSSQTKWYGESIAISDYRPSRNGYLFAGWSTDQNDGTVDYMPNAAYSSNASMTLYAVWTPVGYTISYNANGGTGAPASQTKYHDINIALSSIIPTRENYNFIGWSTSASSTTVAYQPASSYTANASITLYAIWELGYIRPRITIASVDRCDSTGVLNDEGTYAVIEFNWACDLGNTSILVESKRSIDEVWTTEYSVSNTESSGSTSMVIGNGVLESENTYDIRLTVSDTNGKNDKTAILTAKNYPIDVYAEGKGVAFGKPAELEDTFDVDFQGLFRKGLSSMTNRGTTVDVGNYADYGYVLANINVTTDVSASNIPFKMARQYGDCFTVNSDGGIKVGANVNLVRVTACIGGSGTNGRGWAYLRFGNGDIIIGSDSISYGTFFTVNITAIFDVKENDIIHVYAAENMKLNDGGVGCYVYVERIK